ncbi:MAG: hypothetical protein U0136_03535 [Bdellovibrionota bacterium]
MDFRVLAHLHHMLTASGRMTFHHFFGMFARHGSFQLRALNVFYPVPLWCLQSCTGAQEGSFSPRNNFSPSVSQARATLAFDTPTLA